jgi:poly-beta-1,6 N-acetyl-D-glucosamine synthase
VNPPDWGRSLKVAAALAAVQVGLLVLIFTTIGDARATWSTTRWLAFWGALTALLFFLLVVILRYLGLLGGAFLAQQGRAARRPDPSLRDDRLPPITVIVPAYNEAEVIEASIRSLLRLNYPRLEILVIDDGSRDATALRARRVAQEAPPGRVRVITQPNGGKATALNTGIRASRGEFVFCMDADSVIAPDSLRHAIEHLMHDPTLGAVAGAVDIANDRRLLTRLQALEYVQGLNIVRQAMGWAGVVNIIPGPVGLFRKTALLDVGGYDTDTFAEDCDVTLKLLVRGWKITYEPRARAATEAPETLRSLFQQRYRWTRGIIQALRKHRGVLARPFRHPVQCLVLWYMVFEALAWPVMNLMANLVLVYLATAYGTSAILVLWWLMLTLLDLAISLFAVSMEAKSLRLVPHAVVYRMFFSLAIDTCKVLATLEEVMGVGMRWGKLARLGRI